MGDRDDASPQMTAAPLPASDGRPSVAATLQAAQTLINQCDNWRGAGNLAALDQSEVFARALVETLALLDETVAALRNCREYIRHSLGSTSEIDPYPDMNAALAKAEGRA